MMLPILLRFTVAGAQEPSVGSEQLPQPAIAFETEASKAVRDVLSHPDFKLEEKQKVPRWKNKNQEQRPSDWMKNIEAFFKALARVLRAGVWVLAAIGVLILVFTVHYWWRVRGSAPRSNAISIPTHVGGLDIRAESLPDDIPGAARSRWSRGDREGALSLLYRGALSALVHTHACRIGASYTEEECVSAAKKVLDGPTHLYFAGLARIWVLAIYGRRWPDEPSILHLIDAFGLHFPPRTQSPNVAQRESTTGVPA